MASFNQVFQNLQTEAVARTRLSLYLLTDREAPNKKVVAVPIDRPDPKNWKTVVAETRNAIESARLIAGKLAVNALVDVASEVQFYNLDGSSAGKITPPGLGAITGPSGRFDRQDLFYTFTSPLYAATVFRYDIATGQSTPFEPPKLTFDASGYITERVFFNSKDGTRVPMFITHKKGLKKDGTNPTMLYGYGGFDIATLPTFRPDGTPLRALIRAHECREPSVDSDRFSPRTRMPTS